MRGFVMRRRAHAGRQIARIAVCWVNFHKPINESISAMRKKNIRT
jgi:hypothetical protein